MAPLNGQQFLFNPTTDVPLKQPHQMKPLEFANHPDTVWHGSDTNNFEDLRRSRVGPSDGDLGFHVGTLRAATDRLRSRKSSTFEGSVHPVRLAQEMRNSPDNPIDDWGNDWDDRHAEGYYYRNDHEDPGSISAVVESPHSSSVMHYADYVREAVSRGGIPSGEGEHIVMKGTGTVEHSPGFSLKQWRLGSDGDHRNDRLEPRPPYRNPWAGGEPTQGEMLRSVSTYDPQGNWSGSTWAPEPSVVPPEHRAADEAAHDVRQKPWVDRMLREAKS